MLNITKFSTKILLIGLIGIVSTFTLACDLGQTCTVESGFVRFPVTKNDGTHFKCRLELKNRDIWTFFRGRDGFSFASQKFYSKYPDQAIHDVDINGKFTGDKGYIEIYPDSGAEDPWGWETVTCVKG